MQPVPKDGLVFNAIPSDTRVRARIDQKGRPKAIFPGRLSLTPQMWAALGTRADFFWHSATSVLKDQRPNWIINALTEPDRYPHALNHLKEFADRFEIPVFNRPECILQTCRAKSATLLDGIPNLVVPHCTRFTPGHPRDFRAHFEENGYHYPVMVRVEGSQTGRDLTVINTADQWDNIHSIPWGGRDIYMTQFVDYRSKRKEWCKLRLVVTSESASILHLYFDNDWFINNRVMYAQDRPFTATERELGEIRRLSGSKILQQIGADARARLGLDYFGLDLGVKSDDTFVLFEANASMSILGRNYVPKNLHAEFSALMDDMEQRVWSAVDTFVTRHSRIRELRH